MTFAMRGLLGEQVNEIINENYEVYKGIFELSEDINIHAQEITYLLNIKSNDLQGIVSSALFIKILNTFQSIIILYKIGLESQCRVLTRSALESLFVLKCIVKDDKYLKMLIDSDNKAREKLLIRIKKNPSGVFDDIINEMGNDEIDKLISNSKTNKIKTMQIKDWAEMSDSQYYYYYVYNHLCKDVHVDMRNMEQYIKTNKEGDVEELIMLPDIKDIKIILGHTANYIMLEAIIYICDYTKINNKQKITYFENKINEIDIHYNL